MTETPTPLVHTIALSWRLAVQGARAGASRLSLLYSGGLDSSLVAFELRGMAEVELVTIGVAGSSDLIAAEEGARLLDMPWVGRTIDGGDVERVLRRDQVTLDQTSPVSRAVLVSTALALDAASCAHVLCGQGADELFLGYAHFEKLSPFAATERRRTDLEHLLGEDWPRSIQLAEGRGKTLSSPYLEPEFLNLVRALPVAQLREGEGRKPLLRDVAESLGLPERLVHRPKKAFQYGSGVDRLLRSRSEGR